MKFTKTAVAVAIAAGIAAAPMIASADTTLSGIVQIKLQGNDQDTGADPEPGDPTFAAGDVLFGIVSEHEMNNGLTGYGSLRVDVDQLSNSANGGLDDEGEPTKTAGSADSVYAGIKGGFGDIRVGEIPLAVEYGQVANDIFDVGDEINGGLSYTGSFGPATVGVNFSPENNQDAVGVGAKFSVGGFAIGVGAEDRGENEALAAGASFALAGAAVAAHYWSKDERSGITDAEGFAVQGEYGFGGVIARLTFATLEGSVGTTDVEGSDIRLDLIYDLGGGTELSARVDSISIEDSSAGALEIEGSTEDQVRYRVQLSKFF